jgi:hypothetical protein
MEKDAIIAIQDMGAAGLTSSSVEMAARGGLGIAIDLDKVPKRDAQISPYEILLSESQERMLIVARAGAEHEVMEIFGRWDLDAVVIGAVTDDQMLRVSAAGEEVVALPIEPLAHGAPVYERPAAAPDDLEELQRLDLGQIPLPGDYGETLPAPPGRAQHRVQALGLPPVRLAGRQQHRRRSGLRQRHPAHQGHQQGDRAERRLQQPLLLPRPLSRRDDRGGRVRPQRRLRRRRADRA